MADAAKLEKGDKVLDIGCGVGILADQFDKLGYSVVGVDVSAEAIKNSISPKNCFLIKNTSQLNYPNKYFDLVVSREVLEHISIDEIDVCINEWDRVSNGEMIHIIAVTERGPSVNDDPTHVNVQSEKWWTEKFSKHGYKTIKNPKKLFFSALGNNGYLMFVKDI
jgi:ubiquinone/menaquinone biosynthesis C-methylase UbiE